VGTGSSQKMRHTKEPAFSDEVGTGSSQKMRHTKEPAFSDEVGIGSSQKMRPNQKLEWRSDSPPLVRQPFCPQAAG